jgi:hypothetical protein
MARKPMLTHEEIQGQTALELPERDMLALVTIIALNGVRVFIPVQNNDVAVQVCAQALASGNALNCTVTQ